MNKLLSISLILGIVLSTFASGNPNVSVEERSVFDCAIATVKDEYKRSKAVFIGKVVKITEDSDTKTFEFAVQKYWKGVKRKTIKIKVSKTMRFEPFYQSKKSYLIYAFVDEQGFLRVEKCTRGSQIEFAKEDLKILGKAKSFR